MSENRILPTHELGYAIELERKDELEERGLDVELMLRAAEDNVPKFNNNVDPNTLFNILNQGNQGSCQGHSLAMIFTICYYLATGRIKYFSRAAAYYLSQRKDGIRGDRGSTLSGGRWVATEHGLCAEEDWPYPSRYNPREPAGLEYPFKLVASKPIRDIDHAVAWLEMGLPIQDGIIWDNSVSREVSDYYVGRGGGGHSTVLWSIDDAGNYVRINSWGEQWRGDGCSSNTRDSLKAQLLHRYSSHIAYGWEGMIYPDLNPVTF